MVCITILYKTNSLNDGIKFLFYHWKYKNFHNHADKFWQLIEQSHGGKINDS